MASYSIVIRASAVDELLATPFPFRRQINQRIFKLKADPRPADAELVLEGEHYRFLIGAWWIVYEVDDEKRVITIVAITIAETGAD